MSENECEFLQKFSIELKEELLGDILPYWIKHTVDQDRGGFYGRITFQNDPVKNADKGSILTARVLWTFSACFKMFGKQEFKEMADHAYKYLTGPLWDITNGGVYWMVDANGSPSDSRKHVYAQDFAIYALSEYYSAFKKVEALHKAKELFTLVEKKCVDTKYGGYFEAYTDDWELLDDVRLSDKDKNEPKSMNTHLHALEAYTNLYRYWKDPKLKTKLKQLIDIFVNHIVNDSHTSLHTFLSEDWVPRSDEISYGHDIETSWLLLEAAEIFGDDQRTQTAKEISLSIAKQVMKKGVDHKYGGIYNEADFQGLTDDNKDWWPQAEGIVGFLNAYQITENSEYLNASYELWEFIQDHFLDKKHGEWHEKVSRSGVPFELDKVRSWKCPYHNGRTVLEIINRVQSLIELNTEVISSNSVFEN